MKEQSTGKGFAILSAATMAVKLLSIIYVPFLLRIIGGNRPYAIYSVTYQIYAFVYVLTNAGIPSAISKLVSEFMAVGNYRSAVKSFKMSRFLLMIIGIVMALIMFFVSKPLTEYINYKEARYSVIALCPAILFTSVASAYRGYFQGRSNMKPTAVSQVLEQVMNTVFSLAFAAMFIGYGIEAGIIGATVGTTLGALASTIYLIVTYERNKDIKVVNLNRNRQVIRHTNKQIMRRIIKYSVPITICVAITNAGNIIDSSNITARLIAGGAAKDYAQSIYGMYGKYMVLINMPITIISALAMAVMPAVSKAVALKDKELVKSKINFAFKINFLIAIPAAVGFSVLGGPIYRLLHLGDGYRIMIFGSIVVVFMALVQILTSILQGMGRLFIVTFYSFLGLVLKYIINYILVAIPAINIYGAIIGSAAGFALPIILNIIYLKKTLKLKIDLGSFMFKPIISSVFMCAVAYVVYNILSYLLNFFVKGYFNNAVAVIISIVVAIMAYLYAMILNNGITKDELDIIPSRLKKFIPKKIISNIK